jgi:mycofactocin precursor
MHAVMIAAGLRLGHLSDWPGITARSGSYPTRAPTPIFDRKVRCPRKKGIDEMTDDSTREEENVTSGDELLAEELLVEEVSIDGMCGVY